jgi:hypothetical protein
MISLSVEDEQGSERLGEADGEGEEDDAVTSAGPAAPPSIEEEPAEPAVVWEGGAAPRTFAPPGAPAAAIRPA